MKKFLYFSVIFFLGAVMFSCEKEELANNKIDANDSVIAIDEVFQAVTVDDAQVLIDLYSGFGEGFLKSGSAIEAETCPVITVEKIKEGQEWPRKVTLDIKDGCQKGDQVISGKMIMIKSGPWMKPGSVREVSFENYSIDKVKIAGNKRIENITEIGGKVTFKIKVDITLTTTDTDGKTVKVVTRKEERKQVWQFDFTKFEVGMGKALNGVGFEYSGVSIITTQKDGKEMVVDKKADGVLIQMGCKFPQKGKIDFMVKNFDAKISKFSLDFGTTGNGSNCQAGCDCMATVTVNNVSEVIDMGTKWREKYINK
jgi:hypothetical protein